MTRKVSDKGGGWRVSDLACADLECGDKTTVRQQRRSDHAMKRYSRPPEVAITSVPDCGDLRAGFTGYQCPN